MDSVLCKRLIDALALIVLSFLRPGINCAADAACAICSWGLCGGSLCTNNAFGADHSPFVGSLEARSKNWLSRHNTPCAGVQAIVYIWVERGSSNMR